MSNISFIAHKITTNTKLDTSLFSEINFQNFSVIEFVWLSFFVLAISLFIVGLFELIFKFLDDIFS